MREPEKTNVILVTGDGMGYNSVDAASLYQYGTSLYQSQRDNPHLAGDGGTPRASQVYQGFPTQVAVDTGYVFSPPYADIDAWASPTHVTRDNPDVKVNVTDSAAAATAMSTGLRTRGGYLGLDRDEEPLRDLVDVASDRGLAVGLVTTARFWTDTAAGFAVHADDGETDSIIDQLLYHEDIDVLMGSGHPAFTNNGEPQSMDHRYITEPEWLHLTGEEELSGMPEWTLIDDRKTIQKLGRQGAAKGRGHELPDKVLGLAKSSGALFRDRPGDRMVAFETPYADNIMRLEEMTRATLNLLDNASDEGFFTMIEAATIDGAAHSGELGRQIEDQSALNLSVEAAVKWVQQNSSWEETTIIVTSDHETGNLWGPGTWEEQVYHPLTGRRHHMPEAEYADHTDVDEDDPDQPPHYHTHQLVPLYARGPLADDLAAVATGSDPVRGDYLLNTDIGEVIREHLGG